MNETKIMKRLTQNENQSKTLQANIIKEVDVKINKETQTANDADFNIK